MTLQQINYVLTIAEKGSMNKAAESLFISQPSLTKAVRSLENDIGITIFTRSRNGMIPTKDGIEFLKYARQLHQMSDIIINKYNQKKMKRKFAVSTQHYSFAVKAFVETVKNFDTKNYEFAIKETKTYNVLHDVADWKSEIGIIYLSSYNNEVLSKIMLENDIVFEHLIDCKAYVYLWRNHPLASKESICFEDLSDYPCLSFEQGDNSSSFFAEEILSEQEYPRIIKANDRATMLNLMIGLNGYTLCSGIICEELNGSDFIAVPFIGNEQHENSVMEIGYIHKSGTPLSDIGEIYIKEIKKYLGCLGL